MPDSFPNLTALAADAGRETSRRTSMGNQMHARGNASNSRLLAGKLEGDEQAEQRGMAFQAQQAALDTALARREQHLRNSAAMAQARLEHEERMKQAHHQREMEQRENGNWYDQQSFQTDEAIRQAEAVAAIQARYGTAATDDSMPRLSDFGSKEINPMRGQALTLEGPEIKVSKADRDKARQLWEQYGENPVQLALEANRMFPGKPRTASLALWQVGYRGPTGAAPLG